MVWNLLSNAVKFTPAGGRVHVTLERVDSQAQIRVADTGRGIEPEFLRFVFDRFRQADSTTTRSHGGLGIGLTIVRHIVELHGGTVSAHSPGLAKGAEFTVNLPVSMHLVSADAPRADSAAGRSPPCPRDIPVELAGKRVLLVDDEADAREVACKILRQANAECFRRRLGARGDGVPPARGPRRAGVRPRHAR